MLIDVIIEGQTPLLCNKFTDAAAMAATNGSRASAVGDKGTPREQAEARLYTGHDGKCVIPQPNIFRAIIDAGAFFKAGKSKNHDAEIEPNPCLCLHSLRRNSHRTQRPVGSGHSARANPEHRRPDSLSPALLP